MDAVKWMSFVAVVGLSGCGGTGTVVFTTWGEEYIEEGIPQDSTAVTGFVDGWQVEYGKFVVVLQDITLATATGTAGPSETGARVVDLTRPGPVEVVRLEAPAQKWDRVSYAIAPDSAATALGGVAAADVTTMTGEGLSLWVQGSATKGTVTKTFDWKFTQGTEYRDCTAEGLGEGVTVPTGGEEKVELTIHGDHFFYDELQSGDAKLRFEALAGADANADGAITLAELDQVQLTTLPIDQYGTGGAGGVRTLKDFVSNLARTIGHYRGEGECNVAAR